MYRYSIVCDRESFTRALMFMPLDAYIANRSQSPPVCNLGQAHQITVFSKAFWVARGRCVLFAEHRDTECTLERPRQTAWVSCKISPKYSITNSFGFSWSRTKPCLQKQYLDSGRGHVHCVTPNCLQLATLLQLLSVSIYGYTTTTCAMQLYVLSLMLSDILWYSVIFRTVFYCWSHVLLVVSTVEFLRIPNGKAFSLAHRFKYSFGTCTGHVKDKTKNPTNTISIATAAGDLS